MSMKAVLSVNLAVALTMATLPVQAQTDSVGQTIMVIRISYDQDSCPAMAEVGFEQVADTVSAFELYVSWDRPDFAEFVTQSATPAPILDSDTTRSTAASLFPVLQRDSSVLADWEYVEARGESGLWVKVTALAYLTQKSPQRLILPGFSGTILRLPLKASRLENDLINGDAAVARIDPARTRLSRPTGRLIETLTFHDDTVSVSACGKMRDSTGR